MPEVQNREADTRNWTLEQWKDMRKSKIRTTQHEIVIHQIFIMEALCIIQRVARTERARCS